MIAAAVAANPQTVVVLDVGGPVADALAGARRARCCCPGTAASSTATPWPHVLYGDAEPGGRLPQTFPVDEKQVPFARARTIQA